MKNCPACKAPYELKPLLSGGFTWACHCHSPETYVSSYKLPLNLALVHPQEVAGLDVLKELDFSA